MGLQGSETAHQSEESHWSQHGGSTRYTYFSRSNAIYSPSILIKQREICLLACLSGMAGHVLYGMAPCFGNTGVTFYVEMIGLVPAASEVILRLPEAVF